MEKEIKKLQESVKWILQQLAIHFDGTPQQAHVDATPLNAGFCTPEIAMNARGIALKDNELGWKYTNVYDVPPGFYATTNQWYKNGQITMFGDGSIMLLGVMQEHNKRKLLWASDGYGGNIYIARTHNNDNGYNSPGFRKVVTTFELFKGEKHGVGTTIDLKDSMKHYSSVRIHIQGWGGQVYEANNVTGPVVMFTNLYDDAGGMEMYELKLERVTDTSYKIVRSAQVAITENMNYHKNTNAEIQIIKIEGVK
ncbi:hypothetical protein [Enterococcus faecium]|uniref:hypothetical protein n=1 Tax=Enterococcus TaxID=1350 RepID=UPI0002A2F7FA|nr:hypothetical protein [Enterococcus faecium]ELA50552.1 hypothetical protein OG9_03167 [Enterococcus faecium EnGen0005]EOG07567.1 hypothetical protein SKY_01977 [Enterococcus faecium EnGen0175]ELB12480.1 hypothetical protein OIM_03095 [Enterococcus faecium EnGen0032]KEI56844.1 hypothetical protein P744_0108895 [Enterococcus faecium UC10237]MCD4921324.1 hypothetical protein [Enterococcus faecium]